MAVGGTSGWVRAAVVRGRPPLPGPTCPIPPPTREPTPASATRPAARRALQLCQGGGNLTVRGSIEAVFNSAGAARTVNIVPLEQYVSGVVPNESPAGWGTLGQPGPQGRPWGFQELEAQAVAARSYVMAGLGSYGGYADTCDLDCQTYRGTLNESALTDLAVSDTAGRSWNSRMGRWPPPSTRRRRGATPLRGPSPRWRTQVTACVSREPAIPTTPGRRRYRCRPSRPRGPAWAPWCRSTSPPGTATATGEGGSWP